MTLDVGHTRAPADHVVKFYDDDPDLVVAVAEFLVAGLRRGEVVVSVATPAHRAAFEQAVAAAGVDLEGVRREGRYRALDAGELLAAFLDDGMPDEARFRSVVGGLLVDAGRPDRRVRVFGEMVALLWDEGNVAGAIALEALWNDLRGDHEFCLYCAYPVRSVAGSADLAAARDVCGHHSFVVTPASYAGRSPGDPPADPDVERSQFFVPAPAAAAAVRRFVSDALDAWGLAHLIADATLVVSELATNALVHASSPFRISIARLASAVRIAVHDASAVAPLRRSAPPDATGGRGMTLVAAVAQRWGTEAVAGDACSSTGGGGGKVVWAELASA